jgi:hypothetical protein
LWNWAPLRSWALNTAQIQGVDLSSASCMRVVCLIETNEFSRERGEGEGGAKEKEKEEKKLKIDLKVYTKFQINLSTNY